MSFVLLDSEEKLLLYPCDQPFAIVKQLQEKFCLYPLAPNQSISQLF